MNARIVSLMLCLSFAVGLHAMAADKLPDDWRKEVKLSKDGDLCTARVEKGWLIVERKADERLTWQIVLSKATDAKPPVIETETDGTVSVNYRDGRYWVRDGADYLRACRAAKADSAGWPALPGLPKEASSPGSAAGSGLFVTGWSDKSSYFAAAGLGSDALDAIVRLGPGDTGGSFRAASGLVEALYGDARLTDDGQLLTATRTSSKPATTAEKGSDKTADKTAAKETESKSATSVKEGKEPAEPEPPKIYDADANAAQQIAEALAKAGKDNQRVLLQFGANWCGWCQKLHTLFQTDPDVSAKLKSDYVVVMIDVDKDRNSDVTQRYGQPTRFGLPAIVILDAEGNQLVTKDSGELEEGDRYGREKVLEFLNEWGKKSN